LLARCKGHYKSLDAAHLLRWLEGGIAMGLLGLPEEVYTDLVKHYQSGGIGASLLEKESPETVGREKAVKIEGRNISLVIPKFAMGSVGGGKGLDIGPSFSKNVRITHPVVNFHHIVRGVAPRDDNEMSATLVAEKKGLISKEVVGVKWEGGRVASMLNADAELNKNILRRGIDSLKVEGDSKNGVLRIILRDKIDVVTESSGFIVKETKNRAEKLPSLEDFDIIDRIAGKLKTG
jgi:hypothetical protein